jgi:hypothetical protein
MTLAQERIASSLSSGKPRSSVVVQFEIHRAWRQALRLWETRSVNKPELVITSSPDDEILAGHCSSCRGVQFRLRGSNLRQKDLLRGMFDKHFKRVHMREDASQASQESFSAPMMRPEQQKA